MGGCAPECAAGDHGRAELALLAPQVRHDAGSPAAGQEIMNLHLEILPDSQKEVWKELEAVPGHFVLYGGTALALRLGHRTSVDFDFFSADPFDTEKLLATLPFAKNCEILQSSANTLTFVVDRNGPVKLSFFGGLTFGQVSAPDIAPGNGIKIASINDIFATKLRVVPERSEAKDYTDIAEILKSGVSLETGLGCARAVYGASFNVMLPLKALIYFGDGDLPTLPKTTTKRLVEAVQRVNLKEIPEITWQSQKIGVAT